MATLLLIIIYISFISLGLPDSLLGSAWPVMQNELGVSASFAGIISFIIYGGTIISSLLSEKIIRRFGTGKTTFISVFMTAIALLGFSFSHHFIFLVLAAIPLGLGAGAVDSALNNFVAMHYKAKHMNWLHCFWGIGATAGPVVMSLFLSRKAGWRGGYLTIGIVQICLVVLLFLSLPLWKKHKEQQQLTEHTKSIGMIKTIGLKGAKPVLIAFLCYCGVEATTGLWGSTYLVSHRGISAQNAALYVSLYYLGITIGRLLAGFLTANFSNKLLIRYGIISCVVGAVLLVLPLSPLFIILGFLLLGLGSAPIFPCMLHETPNRFGMDISQSMMGIQMAFAYVGSTLVPPLFGLVGNSISMILFPIFIMAMIIIILISTEYANHCFRKKTV